MNRHATQPACASREFPQEHLALQIIYLHVQASANEEQWILWMKYYTSNGNLLVTENLLRVSPWEPMNHDMFSIGNNGCKIVSEIEAQWEGDARIRTQAAGRTLCDARQPIIKVLNNNQFVNREKLNLDHSSWMWNEYHPVPVCHIWTGGEPLANTRTTFEFHLSSQLRVICSVFSCEKEFGWVNTALPQLNSRPYPIVQMWIVMMDGGILPGIVWTDQNNSSANTCRYNVATGSRTPDEGF